MVEAMLSNDRISRDPQIGKIVSLASLEMGNFVGDAKKKGETSNVVLTLCENGLLAMSVVTNGHFSKARNSIAVLLNNDAQKGGKLNEKCVFMKAVWTDSRKTAILLATSTNRGKISLHQLRYETDRLEELVEPPKLLLRFPCSFQIASFSLVHLGVPGKHRSSKFRLNVYLAMFKKSFLRQTSDLIMNEATHSLSRKNVVTEPLKQFTTAFEKEVDATLVDCVFPGQ